MAPTKLSGDFMTQHQPNPTLLRQLLDYDPETGSLTWRKRPVEMFGESARGAERAAASWNSRYAGTPALASVSRQGYARGAIFDRVYLAHRVAWAIYHGSWPTEEIDHINHVRTDNRICNLRPASREENCRNISRASNNSSGVTGVSWHKAGRKWLAVIVHKEEQHFLGLFTDFHDAVAARKTAERELGFHLNHGSALGAAGMTAGLQKDAVR